MPWLLNCFWKQKNVSEILFWKSHFKLMCSFGLKVTWQCMGLELCSKNLWYCHGKSVFAVPHLFQGELQVEESFSSPQRGRRKSLLPACCYSGLLVCFFFFFSIPSGVICSWKYTAFFFKPTDLGFCMSHVQLWQYEKPHLFKRHWYIKYTYWNPNLRFLKQMCRKKYLQRMTIKQKIKTFKVKITMNFSSHCKHFPNYCF